eukprot:gene17822-biopygen11415
MVVLARRGGVGGGGYRPTAGTGRGCPRRGKRRLEEVPHHAPPRAPTSRLAPKYDVAIMCGKSAGQGWGRARSTRCSASALTFVAQY